MDNISEGWQAEKRSTAGRYHYIVETMALCRGFGFYTGELSRDEPGAPKGKEDCAACFELLRRRKREYRLGEAIGVPRPERKSRR